MTNIFIVGVIYFKKSGPTFSVSGWLITFFSGTLWTEIWLNTPTYRWEKVFICRESYTCSFLWQPCRQNNVFVKQKQCQMFSTDAEATTKQFRGYRQSRERDHVLNPTGCHRREHIRYPFSTQMFPRLWAIVKNLTWRILALYITLFSFNSNMETWSMIHLCLF